MYPSLYHFFYDNFGLDINGLKAIKSFGFFVAIGFIVGSSMLAAELKRMEKNGVLHAQMRRIIIGKPVPIQDLVLNAVLGFFLGYKLIHAFMHGEVFDDFPAFLFSSQGNIIAGIIGAAIFGYWRYAEGQKKVLPEPKEVEQPFHPYQHAGTITLLAALFGFIGARFFAYLENPIPLKEFFSDPFSGFTVYGGMIGGILAGSIYLYRQKMPLLRFYDAVAPALMLSYAVGRIGCHVSGDGDWGIVNNNPKPSFLPDWLWAYNYPNNVNMEGVPMENCIYNDQYCNQLPEPVYPTPLYEIMMCLVIFGILWYYRKKIIVPGVLFFMYLAFNGVERFTIEQIRVNEKYNFAGISFTQAQLISSLLIITGIAGIVILLRKHKNKSADAGSGSS